jgi:hypothetical protein
MPIASSARAMVPSELQQLIGVDYRALKDSPTAQALKDKVMPQNLKDLETALKGIGISSDRDLDQLDFASFRTEKKGIQTIGVAQGSFSAKAVLKKMKLKKISGVKYGTYTIYPMDSGLVMTFLDDNTLAFGEEASLKSALDTRDGKRPSLDSNPVMSDQMSAVDGGPLWSILDQQGTQAMMMSAMGDAGESRRLRQPQEADSGFPLHHELSERSEFRSDGSDGGLDDGGYAVYAAQGRHALQEDSMRTAAKRRPLTPPPSTPTALTCNSTSRATTRNSSR